MEASDTLGCNILWGLLVQNQVKHPERAKSEAGELRSKLENYLKRAKEAREGKKK